MRISDWSSDLCSSDLPDDRPRLEREMRDAIENRTGYDAEYRVLWPDGSEHWLIVRGHALYREDGTPGGMTGVTLDITERRSAEEESRKERDRVELLFREFNHRVKNNLQMIESDRKSTRLNSSHK